MVTKRVSHQRPVPRALMGAPPVSMCSKGTESRCCVAGSAPDLPTRGSSDIVTFDSQHLDAYRLAYVLRSTTPNDVTNCLIVDPHIGTEPNGTITAAITLPVTQQDLAMTILDSPDGVTRLDGGAFYIRGRQI